MSTGTPSLNNTTVNSIGNPGKIQSASNSKSSAGQRDTELNFTDFFSTAMGQAAPQAKLTGIEQQLREALQKQDKDRQTQKDIPSAEAAQAAVWAQRNWMQNTQPASFSAAGGTPSLESVRTPNREPAAKPVRESAKDSPANTTATQPARESQAQQADTAGESTAAADQAKPIDQQANSTQSTQDDGRNTGTTSTAQAGLANAAGPINNTTEPAVALASGSSVLTDTQALQPQTDGLQGTIPQASEAGTGLTGESRLGEAVDPTGLKNLSGQQNTKTDALDTAADSSKRNDKLAGNMAGHSGASAAAQVAQQAPQLAQQMQALKGTEDSEQGLKIGQKILAAGGLQGGPTANGMAVGLNGLNSTGTNAQQALIKTPVNQPGFSKELGQTVQWAIGKNLSTVDIRVNPESFGPMNMRLVQKGQQVQLVIRTQDEASANLLTQALGGLKEVLAQNGLQLNQVQIQHGPAQQAQGQATGQQANNPGQHSGQESGHGHGRGHGNSASASSQPDAALAATTSTGGRKPEGSLDLFA